MKSPLGLLAIVTLFNCMACSSSSDGNSTPESGAGAMNSAGGAHAGAASGGTPNGGASAQGGGGASAGSVGTAGSGTAGSAGNVAAGGSSGTAGAGSAGAGMSGSGGSGSGGAGPLDGAALFAANCLACHGAQGAGGQLAPEIQHPVRDYSAWVVRNGRPGTGFPAAMAPLTTSKLPDTDLKLIWDYLDQPPQPTTGQALYHDYCANCHGADGKGGPTGRGITGELGKLKAQVRSGASLGQFSARKNYMPAYPTSRLSDADVNLIYTYVGTL